jgi:hypothetical protein
MMEPARSSQNSVTYLQDYTRLHSTLHPEYGGSVPPKSWFLSTKPQGITHQQTVIFTAIENPNLTEQNFCSKFQAKMRKTKHSSAFMQPLLQWRSIKNYILWVCICSLRYTECNAHASYCHLWPAPLYNIFPHYLINGTIFPTKKMLLNITCVFWFSVQLLPETFLILRRNK